MLQDSSICSAAVHAGVIDPNENRTKEVSFSKINSNTSFVGSVRNRRVSDSFSHRLVGNTATKIFQWLTNKIMMTDLANHNTNEFTSSRRHKSRLLWLACLWIRFN
ncbi:hypothetical protein Avbf_13320 [Armadillidium vulgare]|nr:hypothetical protein Avbf_13320 [Armadillidium vulgare]